jgi:aquaporin Z
MAAAFVTEVVFTALFLLVIMGATSKRAPAGFAPIAIGLALTLIHLVTIPVTNTSVNPARSTGPAIFVADSWAISQLWLFWVAPLLGGVIGGAIYRFLLETPDESIPALDEGLVIEATGPQSEGALRVGRRRRDEDE